MKRYVTVIGEITAQTFQNYVNNAHAGRDYFRSVGQGDPSDVLISSPGGDIGYMLAILDDIDYWKRTTYATGINQSAAAILATAGEGKRICTMDALFRFIPPVPEGTEDKVSDHRFFLHSLCIARLAARLKCPRIEVHDMFDGEFISSTRAKELGLIDEIISTEVPNGDIDRLPGSQEPLKLKPDEFLRD